MELSLILCNGPSNHYSDVITATAVERVLKKLLANALFLGFEDAADQLQLELH